MAQVPYVPVATFRTLRVVFDSNANAGWVTRSGVVSALVAAALFRQGDTASKSWELLEVVVAKGGVAGAGSVGESLFRPLPPLTRP